MKGKKTMKKKKGGSPPKSKYKDLTYKSQVYRTKKTNSGERLYNPLTKRWIKNTASNRNSVLKQIEKSNIVKESPGDYRFEQFSDEVLPDLFKSPSSNSLRRNTNKSDSVRSSKSDVIPDTPVFEEGITVESCDLTMKTELIDLDDIQESKDTIIDHQNIYIDNDILTKIPGLISYRGIELPVIEEVTSGGFGTVYRYSSITDLPEGWTVKKTESGTYYGNEATGETQWQRPRKPNDLYYSVAVKVYKKKTDNEINTINMINKKLGRGFCNTVNAKIIELNNNYKKEKQTVAIMDSMDGSLDKLPEIKDPYKIKDIIEDLTNIMVCLFELGYAYTDIKDRNILYKCYKNNKIKLSLGDLGGLCFLNKKETCTYPPPEHMFRTTNNCTEKTMVWGIGIVALQLLQLNTRDFAWDIVDEHNKRKDFIEWINITVPDLLSSINIEEVILADFIDDKSKINIKYTFRDLIVSMLEPDPTKRISLIEILYIIAGIKSSVIKRNTNPTLLQDKRDPEIVFEEYSVD